MKDFPFWRDSLSNAKTPTALNSIGQDLARFQKQSGLFGDEDKKLTDGQVMALRTLYSARMKKLEKEALPPQPTSKPKFKNR